MSRKTIKLSVLCASLTLAAAIAGCGTSNKEGTISLDSVARVGDTACFQCHAGTADPLTNETFVEQYQRSLHAELGCESCHGGGAQHNGVGPFPFTLNSEVSDADKAERCAMCHNGTDAPLSSSINFSNGNHGNMFSAEEAHEAKCARCHSHEGSVLYGKEGYTGSQDIINNTSYQPVLARDPETFNTIKCATCHEHGGNLRQTKTRDLSGTIVTWDPNNNKVIDQYDLCTSCHNMTTNEGKLIGSGNILQVYTSAASGSGFRNISTSAYYHNTAWYRALPSTHYDFPASRTTASGTTVEGYVIRTNTDNPCFDCHGHEFKTNTRALAGRPERGTTIHTDWAQSAHAGHILTEKVAAAAANPISGTRGTAQYTNTGKAQVDAVMKAGATDATGIGWTHYDWDDTASRGSCQRCHTATGISNFLNNPTTYASNGSGNSFTHLAGWTSSNKKSNQQEVLYCWGCHTNAGTGALRNPGAITESYAAATTGGPVVTVTYPDVSGSNVCMGCHLGREVGENVKTDTDADGVRSFINSHYLAAGATLFGESGYEYDGRSYAGTSGHTAIGSASATGTGTNGPCVGCHMTTPNSHKFTNISTSSGHIAGITSTSCATCHTGSNALTASGLSAIEEEYEAALAALQAALDSKRIYFYPAHPYFYKDSNNNGIFDLGEDVNRNGVLDAGEDVNLNGVLDKGVDYDVTSGGSSDAFTNWAGIAWEGVTNTATTWKDVMGAAFNLNLFLHDPGAFAHNATYTKRLIWDSIDFIYDGTLDNDVVATIDALGLTAEETAAAKAYLGTSRP